jgi:hypothetical protein
MRPVLADEQGDRDIAGPPARAPQAQPPPGDGGEAIECRRAIGAGHTCSLAPMFRTCSRAPGLTSTLLENPAYPCARPYGHPLARLAAARAHSRVHARAEGCNERRWLTYEQAGELLGIPPEAARHRDRRQRWRTQRGNDGRTLVLVPEEAEAVRTPMRSAVRTADHKALHAAAHTLRELLPRWLWGACIALAVLIAVAVATLAP